MHGFKNSFARIVSRALPAFALFAAPIPALAQNLVTNGSFETGDLSGWVAPSESYPEYATSSWHTDGNWSAQIAGYVYNPDTLTQQITTTNGKNYRLSLDYYFDNTEGGYADLFSVNWNGSELYHTENDADEGHWRHFDGLVTGTGSDTLRFVAANDPGYIYVDKISLTAAPEPASWAMMVGGFGLIGGMLRTRRRPAIA